MSLSAAERQRRFRARQKGENVPKLPAGQKKGYKQTPEHIQKRKRFGVGHHSWKGDDIIVKSGRTRALRGYAPRACEVCDNPKAERHHKDGNTRNNTPDNVRFLCRKCHMVEDGRLNEFRKLAVANQPKAVRARWNRLVLQG